MEKDGMALAEREIVITRMIDAPRELVFMTWTTPEHVDRWWGPNGFTTVTDEMDVRPGGVWRYMMHGPDGVDYPNWIAYSEVVPPRRLVYAHGGGDSPEPSFHVTVTFEDVGGKTELTMHSVFPTAEARNYVVEHYGAIEGGKQTLARLAEHVAMLQGMAR